MRQKVFRQKDELNVLLGFLDFPMTTPYFKFNAKKDMYELNIEVNDLTPAEWFLRGWNKALF